MTTNNLNKDQFGDNDYDAEAEAEAEMDRQYEAYAQGFANFERDRDSDMHTREYFGDDYNAYRAHKAGDIEKDVDED